MIIKYAKKWENKGVKSYLIMVLLFLKLLKGIKNNKITR